MQWKKIVHILLALAMVLTLLPFSAATAHAATSGKCGDNLTWKLDSAGTLTISGTGKMYDYEYNPGAPWMGDAVKKAVIQSGVTYIGAFAFSGCYELAEVTMADTVTEIGTYSFYMIPKVTEVNFSRGLVKIGPWAFAYDPLPSIIIPTGVKEIGEMAFSSCSSLRSVTIPVSVTKLGNNAFNECSSLTSVTIPNSITSLRGTFYSCSSLKSVTLPETLTDLGDFTFTSCTSLTSIVVPAGVKRVGQHAFTNCTKLGKVFFTGNAPSFGEDPFYLTTTAYYPKGNSTWTSGVRQNYGGTVAWKTYTPTATSWVNSTAASAKKAALSVSVIMARNGYQYRCVITDANGKSIYSGTATLTADPIIASAKITHIKPPFGKDIAWTLDYQYTLTVTGSGEVEGAWNEDESWGDGVTRYRSSLLPPASLRLEMTPSTVFTP